MTDAPQPPRTPGLGAGGDPTVELRVRIFRLICAMTAILCLAVVAPLNAVQHLPRSVHIGNLALGLMSAMCYWQSRRFGRHLFGTYLMTLVAMLDFVWFPNAGSDGSVTHFFYPVLLFVLALFGGWLRWVLAIALWLNVAALHVIEYYAPHWVTPFAGPVDRLVDIETGILCSFVALASVAWFILLNYTREQERVREIASQLATSEANYREIFNSSSDALFVHSADGIVIDVNDRACALLERGRDTIVGRPFNELRRIPPTPGRDEITERFHLALAGQPQHFEYRTLTREGDVFWAEVSFRLWETRGERRVVGSVRDITSRKRGEDAVRLNEERLRLAMEVSHQGWFEVNVRTGEIVSSPEYSRILGYEPAEFSPSLEGWAERLHPADRDATMKAYQEALQSSGMGSMEYRQRTKSGEWKWIRSVAKVVDYDDGGRPLRVLGTHTDISERKELEAQLLHSQRLEAVGTLASGVAHDLNNILTPMLMASGVLRDSLADPRDREFMSLIDEGGRRGAAIVRQLLAFSRNLAQDRVATDLTKLLRDMAQLMRATFPKGIEIVESFEADRAIVEAEPNQLHQVLMNLCVNARDAMAGGGTLTLTLSRTDITATPGIAEGSYWAVGVSDTGHGIPPEIADRIFDPFFTTKDVGKGTGLGLASVHGIIKAHQGMVRVESQPGKGSTFQVLLPAAVDAGTPASPSAEASAAKPTATSLGRGGVLVVDDDPAVRMVTARLLTKMGYSVIEAQSGVEALEILPQHVASVGLVITDFSMPGMDGPTLAPLLREISPTVRILGVSGLNQQGRADELAALGFSEVLSKPYELDDLAQAVRRQFPKSTEEP